MKFEDVVVGKKYKYTNPYPKVKLLAGANEFVVEILPWNAVTYGTQDGVLLGTYPPFEKDNLDNLEVGIYLPEELSEIE